MPTVAPVKFLPGYGLAEIEAGDTLDPTFVPPPSSMPWGGITGALSSQTDLQSALNAKQAAGSYATAAQGMLADSALQPAGNGSGLAGITKTQVGLGSVDNTGDTAKPVSTAQQAALDAKAPQPIVTLVVPTTGQTQTFTTAANKPDHFIACNHVATIAAQTFVFPADASAAIGQELRIFSRSIITAVTLTLNSNTIIGLALATLPVNGNVAWRKVGTNLWARIQ